MLHRLQWMNLMNIQLFQSFCRCVVTCITTESQILSAVSHIKNISKKRTINERILSYLNKKGIASSDEKTVKEVLCSRRTKNLLNGNDLAESEENGIPISQPRMS